MTAAMANNLVFIAKANLKDVYIADQNGRKIHACTHTKTHLYTTTKCERL